MSEKDRQERLKKLDGAHLLWASTMGATFDLGIMSKAMLVPSMKTATQRLIRHKMQMGSFPFIDGKELNSQLYKELFDDLNKFMFFADGYDVEGDDKRIVFKVHKDKCMYCPTSVGGALLRTTICPYPVLFGVYLDMIIKNGFIYKSVNMVKQDDGSYMKREDEYDIIEFKLEDDDDFFNIVNILEEGVNKIEKAFQSAIENKEISEEQLWDRNYIEVPGTNPRKYTTKFTDFAKKYIQPIEDEILSKHKKFVFVVLVDDNGYLPSHNSKYDKPLTSDYKKDLLGNRSMRIFNDFTGITAARNTRKYILQPYPRDVGVLMFDISSEIKLNGKHWGALRIGFKL
ncbi:hypothetical protein [Hippea maritima]|uniref:Uncharacterized protein n=1 Tax=Hippea maritima (strain ATCC 700847 / DSM 10411 / MH2) TaxID=760142 RepID=F2LVV0_HIPMA|nr:hypothetical protein [Hippea maritima]AEA33884.1 hypothetical protein Hipma_0914 [Hippea maritima DSM 10411]